MTVFLKKIQLQNLLSFGPDGTELELRPLNVLIGPNGCGKSNLIEAISLLQAAPKELAEPVSRGGGVRNWIWNQTEGAVASLQVNVEVGDREFEHRLKFQPQAQEANKKVAQLHTIDESIEQRTIGSRRPPMALIGHDEYGGHQRFINVSDGLETEKKLDSITPQQSILSYLLLNSVFSPAVSSYLQSRLYRKWMFGNQASIRQPQRADQPQLLLAEDSSNLAGCVDRICRSDLRERFLEELRELLPEVQDVSVVYEGDYAHLYLIHAGGLRIPAMRLSDGTLRYLQLLTILLGTQSGSLIGLEEPELGLHPDLVVRVARLLEEASERIQLLVTTHSPMLIDALQVQGQIESVVVCQKNASGTVFQRLDESKLSQWLDEYSLADLWSQGHIGGNRW